MIEKENDSLQQNCTILVTLPPYLSFSSFGIMNKSHAVNTATNSVLRHPLMSVLPSLCSNSFDSRASAQWNLQPLTVSAVARAPWPAVIYSPVPWGEVVIVICGGWEIARDQTTVFGTEGHGTSICGKTYVITLFPGCLFKTNVFIISSKYFSTSD